MQCELADRSQDLILEITALRAKISRMRDEQAAQETVIKERVKRDYDDLVHSLFTTSFALKNRFEEYRMSLYDDVVQGLCDVRKVGDATPRVKVVLTTCCSLRLSVSRLLAKDDRLLRKQSLRQASPELKTCETFRAKIPI